MMISDLEIINKIKIGDEEAFELVFKTYYPVLSVFAKKYVYDIEIGKEIVQDLFVRLYESRSSLQINSSLKAYLYKSVQNKCLTYITQTQARTKHLENIAQQYKGQEADESDYMEQAELEERVFKTIKSLPSQCQKIFRMSRMDGKKNKEIAEELDISIRTVETQISKALKILRGKREELMLIVMVLYLFSKFL